MFGLEAIENFFETIWLKSGFLNSIFGYKNYDECILDKMKGVDSNNKVAIRSVMKLCRADFPYEPEVKNPGKIVWKELEIINKKCDWQAEKICQFYSSLRNPHSKKVTQLKVLIVPREYDEYSCDYIQADKIESLEWYPKIPIAVPAYDEIYNWFLGTVKADKDFDTTRCIKIYGKFQE